MAPDQKPKNIVIVGGSLAGLMTGVSLLHQNPQHSVTILERNPTQHLHNTGAGIVASGDTQTFFSRYDRTATPISVESPFRQYLDREGTVISREDWMQRMTSWDLLYQILRAGFDGPKGLYVRLPQKLNEEAQKRAVYRYGCRVIDVKDNGEAGVVVKVQTVDGGTEEMQADMLIAADGPSSIVRGLFCPDVKRTYAGYCAWRGTVLESMLSEQCKETMVEKFTFYHSEGLQVLAYLIPGEMGTFEKGKRLMNWVWYRNAENEEEKARFLTDDDGKVHNVTIPVGKINSQIFEEAKRVAIESLPPQFVELVCKTEMPFVQAVTDVISTKHVFLDGKVILLGDALAGFRPHTAGSTGQAAFDAMALVDVMEGKTTLSEWEDKTMDHARQLQKKGVEMGVRSQFGKHPLAR